MSLRTKLLLSVGLIILVVLGTSTFVYIQSLKQNYLEALEWRSEALAQSISIDIVEKYNRHYRRLADIDSTALQALLRTSNLKTMNLYDANKEKHVAHVSVIDSAGTIMTHNEKSFWDTPVESPVLLEQLQRRESVTIFDGTTYHTLVPMLGEEDVYLGTIDIGVSKQLIDEEVRSLFLQSLGLLALFLLLAFFTVSLLMYLLLTKPVKQLITLGQRLAEGNLVQIPQVEERNDEIIILQTTFNRVANYLQHIAKVASNVAAGVLDSDVRVRSEHDILGKAVHEMLQYLKYIASVATRITEGDLTEIVQVRSNADAFGRVIQTMTEGLHSLVAQIRISADQIASTGETISSLASHDIGVVHNVHSSVEQMMSTMMEMESSVEEVAKSMDTLSSSVEETSASVSQMTASIAHIASNTTELTRQTHQTIGSLDTTVSSLEGIVERTGESRRLAQETIQEALEGQHVVKQVMTSMETIQQTVKMSVEAITQFAQRSQDIDTILDVIRDITEQTSLLALNAAIIAAQAGAHGRGFAVVADEIKSLADGVGSSTKDIAVIVKTLQQNTGRIVKTIHEGATNVDQGMERTQQAQETLQKIITSAERSSGVITEIAGTLHDLRTSSRNVSTAMELVNTMTDDITRATNEQKIITQQINQVVEHVNDMTAEIQHATTEQLTGVQGALETTQNITTQIDQNLESSQQIVSTTDELSLQSDILLQSVDRFKLRDEDDAISSKERLSIT